MTNSLDLVIRINLLEKDILSTQEKLNLIAHEDGILHKMERRQALIIMIATFSLISQLIEFAFFRLLPR